MGSHPLPRSTHGCVRGRPEAPGAGKAASHFRAGWPLMAIKLKPVDVAIIGLGGAGGVAVLPLCQAGLKIAGIEAGTWLDPHSFRRAEINNNVRGWPDSVQKANREVPTVRNGVNGPILPRPAAHAMMNAVGGTTI